MIMKMSGQLCIALVLSFLSQMYVSATEEAAGVNKLFDVEPGGEIKTNLIEHPDGLKCEFTYACQGGTLEEWEMSINPQEDGHYICVVERPAGHPHSYLYFSEFKLKVGGGTIKEALAIGSDPDKACGQDEYKIHKHSVEHTSSFKNGLNRIYAIVSPKKHHKKHHPEL